MYRFCLHLLISINILVRYCYISSIEFQLCSCKELNSCHFVYYQQNACRKYYRNQRQVNWPLLGSFIATNNKLQLSKVSARWHKHIILKIFLQWYSCFAITSHMTSEEDSTCKVSISKYSDSSYNETLISGKHSAYYKLTWTNIHTVVLCRHVIGPKSNSRSRP